MERQERWDDEKEDVSKCWMKVTKGYWKLKEEELNHAPGELWQTLRTRPEADWAINLEWNLGSYLEISTINNDTCGHIETLLYFVFS